MKAYVNFIKGFSLVGKIILCCLYPVGTIAMIVYWVADNVINRSALENAVWQNPTEETVRAYAEYLMSKHLILNTNHPNYWNKQRDLWRLVNQSKTVTKETKELFLSAMRKAGVHINNSRINNNFRSNNVHNNESHTQDFMQEEMNRQFLEQSMEEARKAATPFDHGGYMQGDGFNPSDTMAADAQRQMDSMNNMNNMF